MIHKGDGHLISTLDRSISEVYKDIINSSITRSTAVPPWKNYLKYLYIIISYETFKQS